MYLGKMLYLVSLYSTFTVISISFCTNMHHSEGRIKLMNEKQLMLISFYKSFHALMFFLTEFSLLWVSLLYFPYGIKRVRSYSHDSSFSTCFILSLFYHGLCTYRPVDIFLYMVLECSWKTDLFSLLWFILIATASANL